MHHANVLQIVNLARSKLDKSYPYWQTVFQCSNSIDVPSVFISLLTAHLFQSKLQHTINFTLTHEISCYSYLYSAKQLKEQFFKQNSRSLKIVCKRRYCTDVKGSFKLLRYTQLDKWFFSPERTRSSYSRFSNHGEKTIGKGPGND